MADREGDKSKQPPECDRVRCSNLRETSSPTDMSGETYDCAECGEHFRLVYEDMA